MTQENALCTTLVAKSRFPCRGSISGCQPCPDAEDDDGQSLVFSVGVSAGPKRRSGRTYKDTVPENSSGHHSAEVSLARTPLCRISRTDVRCRIERTATHESECQTVQNAANVRPATRKAAHIERLSGHAYIVNPATGEPLHGLGFTSYCTDVVANCGIMKETPCPQCWSVTNGLLNHSRPTNAQRIGAGGLVE